MTYENLDDLLNNTIIDFEEAANSDFDEISKLLNQEDPEEELEFVDGIPLPRVPQGCTAPGPPTAPSGPFVYPTASNNNALVQSYQTSGPGFGAFVYGVGLRGLTTATLTASTSSNLIVTKAWLYINLIVAADNVAGYQYLNWNNSASITFNGTALSASNSQTIGVAPDTCWSAFNPGGANAGNDGGSPPQNIVNVVIKTDVGPGGLGIIPANLSAGSINYTLNNIPMQPGLGTAFNGSDNAYYPGCKGAQGAALVIVGQDPTNTKMFEVTIWDGSSMVGFTTFGGNLTYTLNFNPGKFILNPEAIFVVGDAQTTYPDQALYNGAALSGGSSFFNPNTGNLLALNKVPLPSNLIGTNTFSVSIANSGPTGDCLNWFLFALAAGDPHFSGFEGERFDFHGHPGKFYNLITDDNIQVNAYFGDWRTNTQGWTANRKSGITFIENDDVYQITIDAEDEGSLFVDYTEMTEKEMFIGRTLIRRLDEFEEVGHPEAKDFDGFGDFIKAYEIRTVDYRIIFVVATDNYNGYYLNLVAEIRNPNVRPHGVVGQTADFDGIARKSVPYSIQGEGVIDGVYTDYEVGDLFDTDFKYNKFFGPVLQAV